MLTISTWTTIHLYMNWEAVSAISEIIGAIAVVVSLVYLAIQVRASSKATRASVYMGLHDSQAQYSYLLLSDPSLRDLVDSLDDPKVSVTDRPEFSHLLTMLFNKYELFYFISRENMFSSDVDRAMTKIIANRLKTPGVKEWWENSQQSFSPEFVEWANKTNAA